MEVSSRSAANTLRRTLAAIAEADDKLENIVREPPVCDAELDRATVGDGSIGIEQSRQQRAAL